MWELLALVAGALLAAYAFFVWRDERQVLTGNRHNETEPTSLRRPHLPQKGMRRT
jgi:hypothetical protein